MATLTRLLISLSVITLGPYSQTSAEERWDFRPVLAPQGVPLQEVRDIVEDEQSAIWIATWGGGVTSIQGTNWTTYDEHNGLPSNWVRSIAVDHAGAVWLGTTRGLCRVHDGKIDVFTKDSVKQFPCNGIRDVECLDDGSLWLSFDDANVVVSCQQDAISNERQWQVVLDDWEVNLIKQTRDGRVWVSNSNEGALRVYDGQRWRDVELRGTGRPVQAVFNDQDGNVLVLADSSLWQITKDYQATQIQQFEQRVYSIAESSTGRLHVGTYGKVYCDSRQGWQPLDLGGPCDARALLHSRDGTSLWIGSRAGVIRGSRFSWRRHVLNTDGIDLIPDSLSVSRSAPPLCLDAEGRINLFEQGQWKARSKPIAIDGPIKFVLDDGSDQLWILTDMSLFLVRRSDGQIVRTVSVSEEMINPSFVNWRPRRQLLLTSPGHLRLVAESGVYALEESGWRRLGPPLQGEYGISSAVECPDGSLYVCYRNDGDGVGYVERWKDGDVVRMDDEFPEMRDLQFETVCLFPDGTAWFGTHDRGILVFDGKSLSEITIRDGLASNLVSSIYPASEGTVWVGYRRRGVSNYRDDVWLSSGESHGLPNWEIRRFGEDSEGRIWVSIEPGNRWFPSLRRGIYCYQPERDPPETSIDDYPTKPLAAHGIGVFSFSAVDAWRDTQRDSLLYSWRFVPSDPDRPVPGWSPFSLDASVTTDQAPLRPGEYTFQVRAADVRRNTDPTPASVTVTVAPPFWKRSAIRIPAIALCVLAFALLCALLRKHASLRASNLKLQRERDERMRAECKQEQLKAQLHQSQKLEALGTLASGVSHDFNNYLTAIVGNAEVLRRGRDEAATQACLDRIMQATEKAASVTRALQTFSRADRSEKRHNDLNVIVKDSINMLRPMLPASIEIVTDQADGSLGVYADATQIQQSIMNLAINGRDAMPEGGVLTVATSVDDGHAVVSIHDTGMGIAEQDRERVFEPFFTTKPRGQGTGLGLSIVHGIVTDHQGEVRIETPGTERGTRISIRLPLCQGPRGLIEDQAVEHVRGQGECILIAEDHSEIRGLLSSYFSSGGYKTYTAVSGTEALAIFEQHQSEIQLLILDIDLPKLSGIGCLTSIEESHGPIPTILISGLAEAPSVAESDHVQFVKKPFSMAELSRVVRRALEPSSSLIRSAR